MKVTLAVVLLAVLTVPTSQFQSMGSDEPFGDASMEFCSNQCTERLMGMPMFVGRDEKKFICCQKFKSTHSEECVTRVKTACFKGEVSAALLAQYAQVDAEIIKKGKTEKPLQTGYYMNKEKEGELKEDDKNQELIDHIKRKANPINEFIKKVWNWKNNDTWVSKENKRYMTKDEAEKKKN